MSLDERIRFGVVGCGGFTRAHLALMASVPGWELAGIVEPDALGVSPLHCKNIVPHFRRRHMLLTGTEPPVDRSRPS